MSVVLLRGALTFENYSETQIKLTVDNSGFVNEYFFNKKANLVVPSGEDQTILTISYYLDAATIQFRFTDIISPLCNSVEEFINIVDGWFYIVGPEVSVNGLNQAGPLSTINFIEGTNITITAVNNSVDNSVDVTIDASGGGGGGVTAVTATGLLTSSGGATPDISSFVNRQRLVGRNSATAGIMEEIFVGPGLTLSGTTLSATPPTIGYEMNFLLMGG